MKLLTVSLAALLTLVHAELWLGKGGVPRVMELRGEVAGQKALNAEARARNEQLVAEVGDLKDGLEIVEEMARYELGMVKADETYVQIAPRR